MTAVATETETSTVKVGDFFSSSWGYDQTNVDFYKVVGLTPSGKSVRVQQWTKRVVSSTGPQDYVVPGDGPATYVDWSEVDHDADYWVREGQKKVLPAPIETKRLRLGGYKGASFTVNSFANAYLWDGEPEYQTGQGWGH